MSAFTKLLKCLCRLWNQSTKVTKADFNIIVGPFSDNKKKRDFVSAAPDDKKPSYH